MKAIKTIEQQKKDVSIALQQLTREITESDKGYVMWQLNKSIDTVRRYLRGEIANVETGSRMVNLFRERIKERQQAA